MPEIPSVAAVRRRVILARALRIPLSLLAAAAAIILIAGTFVGSALRSPRRGILDRIVDFAAATPDFIVALALQLVILVILDDFFESIPVQAVAAASFIAKLGFFSLFIGGTTLQIDPLILRSTKQELIGLMGHYIG